MNTQIVNHITKLITDRLDERNWKTLLDLNQLTNHINSVAQHEFPNDPKLKEGQFSLMYWEEYGAIKHAVRKHLKALQANATKPTMNENKKKALTESTTAIPTPKSILNYTDSDVIAEIKKEVTGRFTLEKIQSNADKIYNVIIKMDVEEGLDFEFERYKYIQDVHKFRVDFFTGLSKKLPVVNVNLAAFEFIKGNETLRFALSVLISDTNIKDWVSGKKTDDVKKERNKKILGEGQEPLQELSKGLANRAYDASLDKSVAADDFVANRGIKQKQQFSNYKNNVILNRLDAQRYGLVIQAVPNGGGYKIESGFHPGQPNVSISVTTDGYKVIKGDISALPDATVRWIGKTAIPALQKDLQGSGKSAVQEAVGKSWPGDKYLDKKFQVTGSHITMITVVNSYKNELRLSYEENGKFTGGRTVSVEKFESLLNTGAIKEIQPTIKEAVEKDFAFLDEVVTPLEEQYKKGRLYRLNEGLVFQTVEFVEYKNGRFLFENITSGKLIAIQPSDVQEKIEHVSVTLDESINKSILEEGWKETVNIKVKDAFVALDKIRPMKGITGANAVTDKEVNISFDNRKVKADQIKSAIKGK
jgi:hypothetical protein